MNGQPNTVYLAVCLVFLIHDPHCRQANIGHMRIDFVITELFVGGAERCLTELAVGMANE